MVAKINDGRVRLIDGVAGKRFRLISNCFEKRKSGLIRFELSDVQTMIDYIVSNRYTTRVKDVKVISRPKSNQSRLSFIYGCVVQKRGLKKEKVQKEIEIVEVERV